MLLKANSGSPKAASEYAIWVALSAVPQHWMQLPVGSNDARTKTKELPPVSSIVRVSPSSPSDEALSCVKVTQPSPPRRQSTTPHQLGLVTLLHLQYPFALDFFLVRHTLYSSHHNRSSGIITTTTASLLHRSVRWKVRCENRLTQVFQLLIHI